MKRTHRHILDSLRVLSVAALGAAVSGCGAGADDVPTGGNDPAAYAATLDYCGSVEPTGNSAQPGGWDITSPHHSGAPLYDVNALVSAGGAHGPSTLAPVLQVEVRDYRNVPASFLPAAYVEPAWKMGIGFLPVFAPRSAACVAGLAKLTPVAGAGPAPWASSPGTYMLSWRSKWSAAIPVERLPGKIVDGFEFVSNFVPQGAQVFFVVSKTRLASTQGVSICYLAPAATQWDCAAAAAADRGKDWQLYRAHGEAGMYVLAAPQ
jgi:hypothetical protein